MSPPLSIRLTEPVIFLRNNSGIFEGHRHGTGNDAQSSFVRGLVTVSLAKPTRISSIEVVLEGKSSTVWIDGPGNISSRRGEMASEKVFLKAKTTLYSAKSCPSSKRSTSLGPVPNDDDDPPLNHALLRSSSTHPQSLHRNSSEFTRWSDAPAQENAMTLLSDYVASPSLSPLYTPQHTPQFSTMELPMISRPETPIDRTGDLLYRSPTSIQEDYPNLEASHDSSQLPSDDSTTASMNSSSLSPLGHNAHGSSSHSSRITFAMHSPPISRSVSGDFHTYNRTASPSPSPNPSTPRGRHSSKWSLSSMTHIFKDATEKIRSASKEPDLHRGRNPEPRQHDRGLDHERMPGVIVQDSGRIDDINHFDSWKEFRKGTHTYPVSFALPADCPPTVSCAYGAVSYTLRAVVHRPGALTPKFTCSHDVIVVASPAEDDTEATHSIAIERQWDTQLRYIISLGDRNFVIGGAIPFSLTLVPLDKCKIYRLSVFLEEKIANRVSKRQLSRESPVRRFELMSIKHPHKPNAPILPVDPDEADVLKQYVQSSSLASSPDEAFASLMGPGPWVLSHALHLHMGCSNIHFSFKHKAVNMIISHTLKIVFRVERGDDQAIEPGSGKRRQFDIVVQMPVRILSCYCNVELTSLPRYTFFATDNSVSSNDTTHLEHPVERTSNQLLPPLFHSDRSHGSGTSEQSSATFLNNTIQFSRLIAGQESTLGDAPPEYQEVPSG